MGSCLSISVAAALYYNERTCSSCRKVLNKNRDKYICLQNQKICNKCIESRKVEKTRT